MNYSEDPSIVRVDFWQEPGGNWYDTEVVKWIGYSNKISIHAAFKESLRVHFGNKVRMIGMRATCLEPYHQRAFPVSMIVPEHF